MCFGSQPATYTPKGPGYTPDTAYKAVTMDTAPAKESTGAEDGLKAQTVVTPTASAPGLNLGGM